MALAQGQTAENPPRFYRRLDLSGKFYSLHTVNLNFLSKIFKRELKFVDIADIRDTIFTSTSENGSITNSFRVILMKPLKAMNESGLAVQKVLQHFAVNDTKKLIVVADDLNTSPGTLMIQNGGDLSATRGHKGLENIVSLIGTEFIRFRLGIGRPISKTTEISRWVLNPFEKGNREMDLFGHLLRLTTQALYDYSIHKDLKRIKKKFARTQKLPNKLTEMNNLVFPVDTHGF